MPERKGDPGILIRYLDRSNQIVADMDDCGVRGGALLTIRYLPINEKPTPFQAYEAITRNQMRGIIHNAGGMAATELKAKLRCESAKSSALALLAKGNGAGNLSGKAAFLSRSDSNRIRFKFFLSSQQSMLVGPVTSWDM
ncbi:hypothetical protein HPB48_018678 [Haemaphysalis longicornis]|uniref:Uncharacterized protein n=1 Tax=Haemaphysalis longicornis TaxID=44386 RepID=A0A9J6GE29_HAELO|nr:hypothetical protein HPB48_018678 [Haemaphysalis longicornis]